MFRLSIAIGIVSSLGLAVPPSIGTDLGTSGNTYLYWREGKNVVQGKCENGKPVLVSNCQNSEKKMLFSKFEDALHKGMSGEIGKLKEFIGEYEAQLEAIEKKLEEHPSVDLEKQKKVIAEELEETKDKLNDALSNEEGLRSTLEKLKESEIVYLVKSDSTLYTKIRPYVKRFESIFSSGLHSGAKVKVETGWHHTCGINKDGVKCWGRGETNIPTLFHTKQIAAGLDHTCAIDEEGVKCWGRNKDGECSVPELRHPLQVAVGWRHSCALDEEGVKCWGANVAGATNVPPLKNPRQIAAADSSTCALDDNGMTCWGSKQMDIPVSIHNPRQISAKEDTICVLDGEKPICWGKGGDSTQPVHIYKAPRLKHPIQISAGSYHACALDEEGVKCWGRDYGYNTIVPPLKNPKQVSAGRWHSCAVDDGGIKCWGFKHVGETEVPPEFQY